MCFGVEGRRTCSYFMIASGTSALRLALSLPYAPSTLPCEKKQTQWGPLRGVLQKDSHKGCISSITIRAAVENGYSTLGERSALHK